LYMISFNDKHNRCDPSGRRIGPSDRPPPDNTQHSQETDIHAPGGIRNRNSIKRAAADPRLRPRRHRDRLRGNSGYTLQLKATVDKKLVSVLFLYYLLIFPWKYFKCEITPLLTRDSLEDVVLKFDKCVCRSMQVIHYTFISKM
jgi:hypothetical protein